MTAHLVLLGVCLELFAAGAAFVVPARARTTVVMSLVAMGALAAMVASIDVLAGGPVSTVATERLLPLLGFAVRLDALGAVFVATTSLVAVAVAVYSVGYSNRAHGSRVNDALLATFVASLLLVPVAFNVATFFFAWELMAVSSLLLLVLRHREGASAREAAKWYAVFTQVGAMCVLLGLLLAAWGAKSPSFAAISLHSTSASSVTASAAFVIALVGFASKAGAVPLHVWLPRAHPEAYTPVSALMSGSMVAMGIYGIVRLGFDLLGGGASWWWVLVLALGVVSALFGALHATTSSDLKRLLAYSTIDVMGLALIGVGAAGLLGATGNRDAGQLALVAALFLVLVHGAFKGAMFLVAGSVERASGSRDLDELGGLARTMPATSVLFAVCALAVIGVPGLGGFAAEWLLLQGLLGGFAAHTTTVDVALLVGVVALALTGGLTAVAYVKALGIGFLGRPRSEGARASTERPTSMLASVGLLAAVSVALGVAPGSLAAPLDRAVAVATGQLGVAPVTAQAAGSLSALSAAIRPSLLLAGVLAVMVVVWCLMRARRRGPVRVVEPWGCGRSLQTPRMQYTATSFAEPLVRVFADVLHPDVDVEVTHQAESKYFEEAVTYASRIDDGVERTLYRPLGRALLAGGDRARRVQNGSLHRYVFFGLAALIAILVALS